MLHGSGGRGALARFHRTHQVQLRCSSSRSCLARAVAPRTSATALPPPLRSLLGSGPRHLYGVSGHTPAWRRYAAATELEQAVDKDATAMTTPVLLTVANMKCGGCSAAVRRILLQQPGVAGAAVNLLTETAVVQLPASATDVNAIAQRAAEALSGKGFPAELRAADEDSLQATAALMRQRKEQEMQQTWVMQIYIPGWLS